jgi:hypothetical protein
MQITGKNPCNRVLTEEKREGGIFYAKICLEEKIWK